jgi:hypothetical protein
MILEGNYRKHLRDVKIAAVGRALLAPSGACSALGMALFARSAVGKLMPAYSMTRASAVPGPFGVLQGLHEAAAERAQASDEAAIFARSHLRLVWSDPGSPREA